MKTIIWFATFALSISIAKSDDVTSFTQSADTFLKKYVSKGAVDYATIKKNSSDIQSLYKTMGTISLKDQNNNTKKAFYINAYNLVVIQSIVKNYPVKSPMDIEGFFDKQTHLVAGERLTLNALEKEKLLNIYDDARFHFVLVCAAKSCPTLMSGAYTPELIEAQLTQRTKLTINDETWLKLSTNKKTIEVSKIFEWYNGDFTSNGKTMLSWINNFRDVKIPASYKVNYYEYDWALND
ncbi:MAG: DUF547 domain-containing protein [Cyclobacteriaceae bacterium]